ncbi:coat protein [Alphaproteobacteria phage PhiJL001]|uniref:Coat protein n=1 Tax=Alphaproteobacteria phage PhiJL001 TaxID=2681607 RepID=Q5DN38_9CAUD|nr:major head protein [Alphaproteobacteria phage PhiJL001]AAT69543.1 coat protein [Alphaproteobacteria phage PhiJL001]
MAGANDQTTQVDDVIVPEVFTPYVQQLTEEKARLIQSGALARNALMDGLLSGGGLTFNVPSWRDLDNDEENVSTDSIADRIALTAGVSYADIAALNAAIGNDSTPNDTSSDQEIAVRLSRNNSWNTTDLAAALAGEDPADSIATRVAFYWTRRLQAAFIATMQGVTKDNAVNDSADYANDITGASFVDGVTNFSAEAYLDTKLTMGDSMEDLSLVMVHSVVYNRMQKNNLIDFIPDARGEVQIPTFLGAEVIVDDGMPNGTAAVQDDGTAGVAGMYETWLFGPGAMQLGIGSAKVPTEVERQASAGNGGGSETLHSRVEWSLHPVGHAYVAASPANGGPSNAATTNNLNIATSWNRVYPERKQIKFARLITREA